MRLRLSHLTTHRFDTPATGAIQILRLTPRNHDGQFVINWRIEVSSDCRLHQHQDAFGNIAHAFTVDGPLEELRILVEGEVETRDTSGVVVGAVERFPPSLYLRETELTRPDEAVAQLAAAARAQAGADDLKLLHVLLERLHTQQDPETQHDPATQQDAETKPEAVQSQQGATQTQVAAAATAAAVDAPAITQAAYQDFAHAFIAAARCAGVPARCVSGYFRRGDGATEQDAGAWAEAHVGGLGWVGFDVANGICTTDAHIRVAIGLDYLGAAPIRGMHYGGAGETLSVIVRLQQAWSQVQG